MKNLNWRDYLPYTDRRSNLLFLIVLAVLLTAQVAVLRVGKLNNIRYCNDATWSGSNMSAKLSSCFTDIPSTGGVIDARGFEGAQTITSDVFSGVAKKIDIYFGSATITVSVDVPIPSNITIHPGRGTLFSVNAGKTLTINSLGPTGPHQWFTGSGTLLLGNLVPSPAYFEWTGATHDGATDDSGAMNKLIAATKDNGPRIIQLVDGTYRASSVVISSTFGLRILGAGNGSAFSASYQSRVLYNGAGSTAIFKVTPESDHIDFDHFEIDCNARVAGSIGLWLSNNGGSGASIQHVVGHDLTLSNCATGMQIGDGGGINNFNANGCDDCHFASNNIDVDYQTLNTEFQHFDRSTFILAYNYIIHASVGAAFSCVGCYFGVLNVGVTAGLSGPFRIDLTDFVSEIDQRVKTIDVNGNGALGPGSTIKDSWLPTFGDTNDITINWGAWAPLTILDTTIVGRTVYDTRLPGNSIHTNPGAIFLPTFDSNNTTEVADPTCLKPQLIGSYNDPTDVDYYIEMTGAHAYKWKRTSGGAYTAAINMNGRFSGPIEHNMWAEFSTCAFTAGSRWIYHTHKSGLNDISSGLGHEGGFTVETRRTNNAAVATVSGVQKVMSYDTADEDLFGLWDATNSIWTCLFPGKYRFEAVAQFAAVAADTVGSMTAYKNGAVYRFNNRDSNGGGVTWTVDVAFTSWMNEGDTMQFKINQVSGGGLNTGGGVTGNWMDIQKIDANGGLAY